jgi:hypothetical protein
MQGENLGDLCIWRQTKKARRPKPPRLSELKLADYFAAGCEAPSLLPRLSRATRRSLSITDIDMPLTPGRMWARLQAARH